MKKMHGWWPSTQVQRVMTERHLSFSYCLISTMSTVLLMLVSVRVNQGTVSSNAGQQAMRYVQGMRP